jgi:hypothetical protein
MDALEEMARKCFGYGRWDAPYWFIGLEEGMSGTLEDRIKAFQKLNKEGLCDCKQFHQEISDYKHHGHRPPLQSTWRVLILILLTYLGRIPTDDERKDYQAIKLGMAKGETALLELFGLPAKNVILGAAQRNLHFTDSMIGQIHTERIAAIRERLQEYRPALVVMYGTSPKPKKQFARLAGRLMEPWDIFREGETLITLMPHPTSPGRTNQEWIQHAKNLRECNERYQAT